MSSLELPLKRARSTEVLGREATRYWKSMNMSHLPADVEFVELVQLERKRQDEKWGIREHLPLYHWLAILAEEFGEFSKEVCELGSKEEGDIPRAIMELVHTAAVAQVIYEQFFQARLEAADDRT